MGPEVLRQIRADAAYQEGVEWGSARLGHPEGKIAQHILQLEKNLALIEDLLPPKAADKLRLLIHTHDTFKFQGGENVPVANSRSHAALAAKFLAKYTDDVDVIAVARFHDSPFASWCDYAYRADNGLKDLKRALAGVENRDLLFTFMLLDGLTEGKHTAPLRWAHAAFEKEGDFKWNVEEMFSRLKIHARDIIEETKSILPLVQEKNFAGIPYRALGPVESWGADIYVPLRDLSKLRPALQSLADSSGRRYAGVLTRDSDMIHLHISRYPRRATQEVPSVSDYRKGLEDAAAFLKSSGVHVLIAEESEPVTTPGLQRATIGLVEGYSESRKRSIEKLIEDGKLQTLTDAFSIIDQQLGDLGPNAKIKEAPDLKDLLTRLRSLNLARTHSIEEAQALAGASVIVRTGDILSVAPGNYLYEEPCAILTGCGGPARKAMFELARTFKQARFTFEALTAHETVNIELTEFCGEPAAKMV